MKLTPPKAFTFWLSIILVVVGVGGQYLFKDIFTATIGLLIVVVGFVLLAIGNLIKGF